MSPIAANQGRTFLQLLAELQPSFRTDRNLPARIQSRLSGDKRFGSRDRRLYRELLYTALRYLPWIEECHARSSDDALRATLWLSDQGAATLALREAFLQDWPAPPPTIAARAAHLGTTLSLLPEWFRAHCPEAFVSPELEAINRRAPLWLRLQTSDEQSFAEEFSRLRIAWRKSDVLPTAIEALTETDLTRTDAYQSGTVEIQDLGSQLLLETVGVAPGQRWFDACAGAGGKTLQLAGLVGPSGHVDAWDPRADALLELKRRSARAGNLSITTLRQPPRADTLYDGVLVDAPCSGTGTWRRYPHLKWCTQEGQLVSGARLQLEILTRYSRHVRAGGLLVYATCSLSERENDAVVSEFLAQNSAFKPAGSARDFGAKHSAAGLTILPSLHNTDGFFVSALRRS